MREKIAVIGVLAGIIGSSVCLGSKMDWGGLCLVCIICLSGLLFLSALRRKYESDLAKISEGLERLMQGTEAKESGGNAKNRCGLSDDRTGCDRKTDTLTSEMITETSGSRIGEDTMLAKIENQIRRIQEIHTANVEQAECERDEMKRLLAEIAHQLRTPLANIETYLALLQEREEADSEDAFYIDAIDQAEQKIAFLVEKFIISARLERKIIQIRKQKADLKETAAEAIFQVHRKAEQRRINIVLRETEGMVRTAEHDRNWMCECVYNLLDNSIKYSPVGSTVTVSLQNNEMFAEISVGDEGIGILPGEENQIFQLFYRGSCAGEVPGYGMGLYITREIVKKHDGFLRVKRKEKGLKVSIFLPR